MVDGLQRLEEEIRPMLDADVEGDDDDGGDDYCICARGR